MDYTISFNSIKNLNKRIFGNKMILLKMAISYNLLISIVNQIGQVSRMIVNQLRVPVFSLDPI